MSSERIEGRAAGMGEGVEPVGKPSFLNIPDFYVSSFTTLGQPEYLTLLCANPSLAVDENGGMGLAQKPRLTLHIPAVEVKELIVLLQDYVDMAEAERGTLTSEFLQGRGVS